MGHLALLVVSVAVADSLNPSTVGPALYYAAGRDSKRKIAGFTLGVFAVSAVAGIIVVLGPGRALLDLVPNPGSHVRHLIELGAGVALLVAAAVTWFARRRIHASVNKERPDSNRSSWKLGAGIMAVELPTAFPYFAVIAAIVDADVPVASDVGYVLLFNLVFIAPLLVILGIRVLAGRRADPILERMRTTIDRYTAALIPIILGIAGLVLVWLGLSGL